MSETRRVLLADAFGRQPFDGNRTGVVPAGADSDDRESLAAELGAPTAFLEAEGEDRRLRIEDGRGESEGVGNEKSTAPSVERAAVAAYGGLGALGELDAGEYTVLTDEGERDVEVTEAGAWVETTVSAWEADGDADAEIAGIPAGERLDVPVGTAGGKRVVGTAYLSALDAALPAGTVGFTFETLDPDAHVYVRGDSEGTEAGVAGPTDCLAVCAALAANDAFDGSFPETLRCETGRLAGREGEVWIDVEGRVGGPVAVSLDGEMTLPEEGDDDILVA